MKVSLFSLTNDVCSDRRQYASTYKFTGWLYAICGRPDGRTIFQSITGRLNSPSRPATTDKYSGLFRRIFNTKFPIKCQSPTEKCQNLKYETSASIATGKTKNGNRGTVCNKYTRLLIIWVENYQLGELVSLGYLSLPNMGINLPFRKDESREDWK